MSAPVIHQEGVTVRLWIAFAIAGMLCGLSGAAAAIDSLDPDDARHDDDNDGLMNIMEFVHGTDPTNPDSDAGGALDGWEVYYDDNRATYDPFQNDITAHDLWVAYARYDSNGDGINDVSVDPGYKFDPTWWGDEQDGCWGEVDSDHWSNLQEYQHGTDPTNPDTDGDRWMDDVDPEPLIPDVGDIYNCGTHTDHPISGQLPLASLQGEGMSDVLAISWESFLVRTD
jgi:hypothetical protein